MKQTSSIDFFLEKVRENMHPQTDGPIADLALEAARIESKVDEFLSSNGFGMHREIGGHMMTIATESLSSEMLVYDEIEEFVKNVKGIHPDHVASATGLVGIILNRNAKFKNNYGAGQNLKINRTDLKQDLVGLESLYPSYLMSDPTCNLSNASTESFGVDIDMALPDLKVSITIALMRFHTSILDRLMPTIPTNQPYAQYVKKKEFVVDTTTSKQVKILDLYVNPEIIDNVLKPIIPLLKNEPSLLVADNIIKPNIEINIIKASVDANKPGYGKVNSTDKIADGVKLQTVYVSLTTSKATETFALDVPGDLGRLSMSPNTMGSSNSGTRVGNIDFKTFLTKGQETTKGTVSTILGVCQPNEGIAISTSARPTVNVISCVAECLFNISVAAHTQVIGQAPSTALDALVVVLEAANASTVYGYALDARFREDNFRKSNKLARMEQQPLAYEIPTAPNIFYDQAISQTNPETNTNNLAKLISIGKDYRGINIIKGTLASVYASRLAAGGNPLYNYDIGANYVSGDMVKPYVWQDTFDANPTKMMQDSDHSGDVKQHFVTYITYAIDQIHSKSLYCQQLPQGAVPTYRLLTTNPILGGIIGQPHYHTALDNGVWGNAAGVEYTLVLPNGVRLECITTTFDIMENQMLIIPMVAGEPTSELNFAHNWNYGTVVGQYVQGSGGVLKRMFLNSREIPIPINPIGALITVSNLAAASFVTEPK